MRTSDGCNDGVSKLESNNDDICEVSNMLQSMSTASDNNIISVCANCGKEGDDLKSCTACLMVKYCNRDCQIAHRSMHKKECRKRAAELHDEKLFKQPPSQYEDCPICFIRLPFLHTGRAYMLCCGKSICCGCMKAPVYDNQGNKIDEKKCAFCRTPNPKSDEEAMESLKKRMEAGDGQAFFIKGCYYRNGDDGYPQDFTKALEFYHRAVEHGYSEAYNGIGHAYSTGRGVKVDKKKEKHYYELAAIGGDATARYNLGINEAKSGNFDRAVKHCMIAIRGGYSDSIKAVQKLYSDGDASKADYTKALQSYQTYLGDIKSDQRDRAAAADDNYRYY